MPPYQIVFRPPVSLQLPYTYGGNFWDAKVQKFMESIALPAEKQTIIRKQIVLAQHKKKSGAIAPLFSSAFVIEPMKLST